MPTAQDHHVRGVQLLSRKNFSDAAIEFDAALKQEPNNTEFLFSQAVTLMNLQRLNEARIVIDKAIELDKTDWDLYHVSAVIYLAQNDFHHSQNALLHAQILNPESSSLYATQGVLLLKHKESLIML